LLIGDALSIDLLLKHGASLDARDAAQLTPLHWAAVKGSRACISRLLRAGAALDAKEDNGKTPADMAAELKAIGPWKGALEDAGFDDLGRKRIPAMSEVSHACRSISIDQSADIGIAYSILMSIGKPEQAYLAQSRLVVWPLIFGFFAISRVLWHSGRHSHLFHTTPRAFIDCDTSLACNVLTASNFQLITKTLLKTRGFGDGVTKSPYFAAIIAGSFFHVALCWIVFLLRGNWSFNRYDVSHSPRAHQLILSC
jgi:hypothetical protein